MLGDTNSSPVRFFIIRVMPISREMPNNVYAA